MWLIADLLDLNWMLNPVNLKSIHFHYAWKYFENIWKALITPILLISTIKLVVNMILLSLAIKKCLWSTVWRFTSFLV